MVHEIPLLKKNQIQLKGSNDLLSLYLFIGVVCIEYCALEVLSHIKLIIDHIFRETQSWNKILMVE